MIKIFDSKSVFSILLLLLGVGFLNFSCSNRTKSFVKVVSQSPSHSLWDGLLQKHVDSAGEVSYKGFIKDSTLLNEYLALLSSHAPDRSVWSKDEQLAYWINAYNAFTIRIVIRNYPVASIKDIAGGLNIPFISSTWDIKFIEIGGTKLDLNNIEHGIIRKEFDEPRIHFALNCASKSCPQLRREAYAADKLNEQLEKQTIQFINDPMHNTVESPQKAYVSKLFLWYSGDFKQSGRTVIDYINRYSEQKLDKKASLKYKDYNWSLNGK